MVCLALSVNLRAAEYCHAQYRGLPSVAEAFGVLTSTDALRNPITVEKLQGPIVMIGVRSLVLPVGWNRQLPCASF
jgi:hypothetical protein